MSDYDIIIYTIVKGEYIMKRIGKKGRFVLLLVLQILVVLTMVAEIFNRNFYNVFLCLLTLVLFNIPRFVDLKLNIKLPTMLEVVILLFIFAAEILGEIQSFYTIFPYWDTILHTINGFIMAAIGFALIDILNQDPRFHINMSPFFVAFVAFCFSMTIGVVWEFFEFGMDQFLGYDMQKDTVLSAITSVMLNPDGRNIPVTIDQIREVMINGQPLGVGGYLDIGLIDTMEDLFVNFIGAAVFSVIGFFYVRSRGKGVAGRFIPRRKRAERDFLKIAREQSLEESENKEKIQSQKRE